MYSIKDIQSLFLSYFSGCYDVAEEQEISKVIKEIEEQAVQIKRHEEHGVWLFLHRNRIHG